MRTAAVTVLAVALASFASAGCDRVTANPAVERSAPKLPQGLVSTWENDLGAYVQFRRSGTVSGLDGCNQFDGTWTSNSSDTIQFDIQSRTERQCVAPATLSLTDTMTWRLDGGTLTLRPADGPDAVLTKRATDGMG